MCWLLVTFRARIWIITRSDPHTRATCWARKVALRYFAHLQLKTYSHDTCWRRNGAARSVIGSRLGLVPFAYVVLYYLWPFCFLVRQIVVERGEDPRFQHNPEAHTHALLFLTDDGTSTVEAWAVTSNSQSRMALVATASASHGGLLWPAEDSFCEQLVAAPREG